MAISRQRLIRRPNKVRLFLDSGAYSAWIKDEELSIDHYISYIKKYRHLIDAYVCMDRIPGVKSLTPTQEEGDAAAQETYDNFRRMRDAGLDPIPVFHQGERFEWLERYLVDEKCGYIGLATDKMIDAYTRRARINWLDHVFTRITDEAGVPNVQTHGFAITSIPLLVRYPWTTVDSTTWSLVGSFGFILVPIYVNGKPDYKREPVTIHVSHRTELQRVTRKNGRLAAKQFAGDGRKYDALGPAMKECIRHFVEDECGEHLSEIRYDDNARRRVVIVFLRKLVEALGEVRFEHRVKLIRRNGHDG